jgi:hypothetical protein
MKTLLKLTVIAIVAFAAAQLRAAQTNLVQTISMGITAYQEGDVSTNGSIVTQPVIILKRATKDIIQLIAGALNTSISTKAKLLLITPIPEDDPTIVIQDGTNRVDVTGFFDVDTQASLGGFSVNTVSGVGKGTEYQIFRLRLRDNGGQILEAHFDVTGLSTVKTATIGKPGAVIGEARGISAVLFGTGDFTDGLVTHDLIVQVTLSVSGSTVQVLP